MTRVAGFVLGAAVLAAATSGGAVSAQGARGQTSRVDPATAGIAGAVTTADTNAPVRGAEVRLWSDSGYTRLATTGGDGRFEFRDLPAAQYQLTASRTGFVSMRFGQRRPFEPPSWIALAEGARATANLHLARGGVIHGRVNDMFGDPVVGARVQVLRARATQGRRRLENVGAGDQTDDTGAFRVHGLPPGEYFVYVTDGRVDQRTRQPPVYYPGTSSLTEARPIAVSAGGESVGDVVWAPARGARVSGVVLASSGAPTPAMLTLTSQTVATGPVLNGERAPALAQRVDVAVDGTFAIDNVPPGLYTLDALQSLRMETFVRDQGPRVFVPETASMPLVVTGEALSGITLTTRTGAWLSGRFVADAGVTRRLPTRMTLSLRSATADRVVMSTRGGGGSEFRLLSTSEPFRLVVEGLPDEWAVAAVLVDGEDVTDQAVDLKGRDATARVVLTDRPTTVGGTVRARRDGSRHKVVVFADDPTRWTFPSRYVRVGQVDDEGHFRIRGLPPDERYLAVALDYLEEGEEEDPQFLDGMRGRATSVQLREGEERLIRLDANSR